MGVAKPYEFLGFGATDVTKLYEFTGFGAMDVTKPYEFIGFGALLVAYGPKSHSPRAPPKAEPVGRGFWVRMPIGVARDRTGPSKRPRHPRC